MKRFLHNALMLAALTLCSGGAWADSGATDRSNAFGYAFTAEQLTDSFPQLTNLPTIYLQVYKTTYDATTGATTFTSELEDLSTIFGDKYDWYYATKITIRDDYGTIKERNEWLGVRGRGNATWDISNTYKKPLRLKFPSKTDLLTAKEGGVEVNHFARAKSWTLLANYLDPSLIRNALSYELGKYVGMAFCPAYKHVDLVVNGRYTGTYQISDQVQVASDRIPIDESTGYFLEANGNKREGFLEDPYMKLGMGMYVNIKSPDPDAAYAISVSDADIKSNPDAYQTNDPKYDDLKVLLNNIATSAQNGPYNTATSWRSYVDMESAVNAFIAMEVTGNFDGAVANNYFYMNDLTSKIFFGPLWDFDLAWGGYGDMTQKHFFETDWTSFGSLCQTVYENDPYFVKALYERWKVLYEGGISTYLQNRVDAIAASISASVVKNFAETAAGGAGNPLSTWAGSASSIEASYTDLKNFISNHIEWLNTTYKALYEKNCANLPEISDEGGESGGTGPAFETEYTVNDLSFPSWNDTKLPASAFNSNATSADIIITASKSFYCKLGYLKDFNNTYLTDVEDYSGATNKKWTITDDILQCALEGNVVLYTDGSATYTVTVINHGSSETGSEEPETCETHDYTDCTYSKQSDGTYRRVCIQCSTVEENGEVYYLFTVYPESAETYEVYDTGWSPDEEHPNAIATVKVTPGLEEYIEGYNIVNSTKDALGNQRCADFRLKDGHPYYSDKKFVATSATYSRSVSKTWGTMILPFKYQNATTTTANFYHLGEVIDNADGTMSLVLTPIDPSVDGNASAYTPVIFRRANDDVSTVTVTGEEITVKKSTADKTNSTVEGWTLVGVVEPSVFNVNDPTEYPAYYGKNIYYISNNKFWHATGKLTNNPFRAYIETVVEGDAAKALTLATEDEGDITAIDDLCADRCLAIFVENDGLNVAVPKDMTVSIYSVGGALIRKASLRAGETLHAELPAGIYVVNGVKVLVK